MFRIKHTLGFFAKPLLQPKQLPLFTSQFKFAVMPI
jgi:hypothetical protein